LENLDDFQLISYNKASEGSEHYNFLLNATKTIDCYVSQLSKTGSSLSKALFEFVTTAEKKKDISIRIATTINTQNIELVKELARRFDVYHVDGTEGNFYIIDGVLYFCDIESSGYGTRQYHRQFFSKHLSFVKLQQNLFENLLNRAIPARDKIKEVERSIQREYIETVRDPSSISRIVREHIETAGFDVEALFATIDSFYWAENYGIIDLLGDASSRGVKVRVLIKIDDETMKETSKNKIKQRHDRINVNFIRQPLRSKITTFIIDQSFSLTIDVNKATNFSQSSGLATYSNSESRVFADYSMFENLWIQAERERHHSIRQAYFEIFSGRKLKDEIYEKDWTLNEKYPG
jgi:predicted O-linked N-acetylglucosamine transferase (SPINDLY family)